MKTEQEQIDKITSIIVEILQDKRVENNTTFVSYLPSLLGSADKEKEVAKALVQAGYGDVSEYKAEIEQLKSENEKLKTKCDDLKKLSDWQREEIKMLKAEVNKGCDNCETIKQGQVDVLKELKKRIYDISPYNPLVSKDNVKYSIDKLINDIENDK